MSKMRKGFIIVFLLLLISALYLYLENRGKDNFPIDLYYEYDNSLNLMDSIAVVLDTSAYVLKRVAYTSTHHERVRGLLSIPKGRSGPLPVIILLHGLGDSKSVDYIEAGNAQLIDNGYAVFRIDIANHGERDNRKDHPFDLVDEYKYRTRAALTQTIFDLRRAVDFLETQPEIDASRIGYYGISLGGIIGTVFCSVEPRIKVPVIVLAGGNLNLMYGSSMISDQTLHFLSIIDPSNFVSKISPRPLLMINAEEDEVILPVMTKLLYQRARKPKSISWFPTKHKDLPVYDSYQLGIEWFSKHL